MSIAVAVVSGKGGVAKTTTSLALAAIAHARRKRVLLVDVDPQGSASFGCGIDPEALAPERTLLAVLDGSRTPDEAQVQTAEGFFLLAAPSKLGRWNEGRPKRDVLGGLARTSADVTIIDTPPGFGPLVQAAIVQSTAVLLVVIAEPYAVRGAEQTLGLLTGLGMTDKLAGIVVTMWNGRLSLSEDQRADIERFADILGTIPERVAVAEAGLAKRSVLAYAPRNSATKAYEDLATALAL